MILKELLQGVNIFELFKTTYSENYNSLYENESELLLNKKFIALYGNKHISTILECEIENGGDVHSLMVELMNSKADVLIKIKNIMKTEINPFDTKMESTTETSSTSGSSTGETLQEIETNTYGYNSETAVKEGGENSNDKHTNTTETQTTKTVTNKGYTLNKTHKEIIDSEIERFNTSFTNLTLESFSTMFTLSVY